eukprot:GHVQ01028380.1.p1 GENE.GHVQ01028380.1~~GHVQ01028380.1.p1  ORF type:complete len:1503 (+),score=255.80 GHVQ01028380.1:734-5242(+)
MVSNKEQPRLYMLVVRMLLSYLLILFLADVNRSTAAPPTPPLFPNIPNPANPSSADFVNLRGGSRSEPEDWGVIVSERGGGDNLPDASSSTGPGRHSGSCPDSSWVPAGDPGRCYKVVQFHDVGEEKDRGTWMDGMKTCIDQGGVLGTIHDEYEDKVVHMITDNLEDPCWIGIRRYLLKRPERGWLWVDMSSRLTENNYLGWGEALGAVWKLVPPEEKCGEIDNDGWGARACWGVNARLKCAVCSTVDPNEKFQKDSLAGVYDLDMLVWKPPVSLLPDVREGDAGSRTEDNEGLDTSGMREYSQTPKDSNVVTGGGVLQGSEWTNPKLYWTPVAELRSDFLRARENAERVWDYAPRVDLSQTEAETWKHEESGVVGKPNTEVMEHESSANVYQGSKTLSEVETLDLILSGDEGRTRSISNIANDTLLDVMMRGREEDEARLNGFASGQKDVTEEKPREHESSSNSASDRRSPHASDVALVTKPPSEDPEDNSISATIAILSVGDNSTEGVIRAKEDVFSFPEEDSTGGRGKTISPEMPLLWEWIKVPEVVDQFVTPLSEAAGEEGIQSAEHSIEATNYSREFGAKPATVSAQTGSAEDGTDGAFLLLDPLPIEETDADEGRSITQRRENEEEDETWLLTRQWTPIIVVVCLVGFLLLLCCGGCIGLLAHRRKRNKMVAELLPRHTRGSAEELSPAVHVGLEGEEGGHGLMKAEGNSAVPKDMELDTKVGLDEEDVETYVHIEESVTEQHFDSESCTASGSLPDSHATWRQETAVEVRNSMVSRQASLSPRGLTQGILHSVSACSRVDGGVEHSETTADVHVEVVGNGSHGACDEPSLDAVLHREVGDTQGTGDTELTDWRGMSCRQEDAGAPVFGLDYCDNIFSYPYHNSGNSNGNPGVTATSDNGGKEAFPYLDLQQTTETAGQEVESQEVRTGRTDCFVTPGTGWSTAGDTISNGSSSALDESPSEDVDSAGSTHDTLLEEEAQVDSTSVFDTPVTYGESEMLSTDGSGGCTAEERSAEDVSLEVEQGVLSHLQDLEESRCTTGSDESTTSTYTPDTTRTVLGSPVSVQSASLPTSTAAVSLSPSYSVMPMNVREQQTGKVVGVSVGGNSATSKTSLIDAADIRMAFPFFSSLTATDEAEFSSRSFDHLLLPASRRTLSTLSSLSTKFPAATSSSSHSPSKEQHVQGHIKTEAHTLSSTSAPGRKVRNSRSNVHCKRNSTNTSASSTKLPPKPNRHSSTSTRQGKQIPVCRSLDTSKPISSIPQPAVPAPEIGTDSVAATIAYLSDCVSTSSSLSGHQPTLAPSPSSASPALSDSPSRQAISPINVSNNSSRTRSRRLPSPRRPQTTPVPSSTNVTTSMTVAPTSQPALVSTTHVRRQPESLLPRALAPDVSVGPTNPKEQQSSSQLQNHLRKPVQRIPSLHPASAAVVCISAGGTDSSPRKKAVSPRQVVVSVSRATSSGRSVDIKISASRAVRRVGGEAGIGRGDGDRKGKVPGVSVS